MRGQFLRLDELHVLQSAVSVERLNTDDRHFVDQMNRLVVVDERHKWRAVVEKVLNPRRCIDEDIAAENRAVGQRKFGIFANFRYLLVGIQGRPHGPDFSVRIVNEG